MADGGQPNSVVGSKYRILAAIRFLRMAPMTLTEWFYWLWPLIAPAVIVVVSFTVPIVRDAIGKFVAGSIQHRFDARIERLRSDLARAEETFRGELRAKEQRINSLVDVALALRSSRQTALDARRLVAVERLWAAKAKLDVFKLAAAFLASIRFEEAAKASATDEKTKTFFEMLDKMALGGGKLESISVEAERPFLTPVVWAAFSAYQAVMYLAVAQLKMLAAGVGKPEMINTMHTDDLLKVALPNFKDYIEKYSASGHYYLLDLLEQNLLKAVSDMLEGKAADAEALEQSAQIIKIAHEMQPALGQDMQIPDELKATTPPPP